MMGYGCVWIYGNSFLIKFGLLKENCLLLIIVDTSSVLLKVPFPMDHKSEGL